MVTQLNYKMEIGLDYLELTHQKGDNSIIKKKISKAYCPAKQVDENPMMEYSKYLIFEMFESMEVIRPEKFGGDLVFENYEQLAKVYSEGKLHPMDLKNSVAENINMMLEPVREKLRKSKNAQKLKEELDSYKEEAEKQNTQKIRDLKE